MISSLYKQSVILPSDFCQANLHSSLVTPSFEIAALAFVIEAANISFGDFRGFENMT